MTKFTQIAGKTGGSRTNPRNDAQKGASTILVPELKNTPTAPTGPPLGPVTRLHAMQHEVRPNDVGGRGAPSIDELQDQEHIDALRSQENVIRELRDYGLDDRQLHSLYGGQGLSGMERFLREEDGSAYLRRHWSPQEDDIISSISGFTFYRPPGETNPAGK